MSRSQYGATAGVLYDDRLIASKYAGDASPIDE